MPGKGEGAGGEELAAAQEELDEAEQGGRVSARTPWQSVVEVPPRPSTPACGGRRGWAGSPRPDQEGGRSCAAAGEGGRARSVLPGGWAPPGCHSRVQLATVWGGRAARR
jgi:hypothetical protein